MIIGPFAILARDLGVFQILNAGLAIIAKHVERRRVEQEVFPVACLKVDPARGQNAEDMAVREERNVAFRGADLLTTRAARKATRSGDSPAGQPSRKTDQPGPGQANLFCGKPCVLIVVPLHEVGVDLRLLAEPGELAGFDRSPQWARQY